jgi:hypothetical protein
MDKQHIINEIRHTAKDGKAIGQRQFFTVTGIKAHQWRGIYWNHWGEALAEAGYPENEWTKPHDRSYVLEQLIQLTRDKQQFPTKTQMQLERRGNSDFPSIGPIQRLGGKAKLIANLLEYCQTHAGYEDVEQILKATPVPSRTKERLEQTNTKLKLGYVYLLKSSGKYKIGHTISALSRATAIGNMTPEGAPIEHLIRTDDPRGIEAYWHNRFADKRGNGEWFALSAADVSAFKRRKFM